MMERVTRKGVLAADEVADASEKQRAEGANQESDGEGGQVGDVGEGVVAGRIEFGG
jgi:hypothetical protein